MEYRHLGKSGLEVSAIGLGCNMFGVDVDEAGTAAILYKAIDVGINYFDTANMYGGGKSEELMGKALKGRRHEVLIGTKAGGGGARVRGPNATGASRKHLTEQLEISLRRLQTDYVDLFQVHRPDRNTPIDETMSALDDIVRSGKARYVGCSNYPAWQMCEAVHTARSNGWTPYVSAQPRYNMLEREIESEIVPFCLAYGIGIIPYYPLAAGFLTGKYSKGEPPPAGTRGATARGIERWTTDRNWAMLDRLKAFAAKRDHTMAELALAWLLHRPGVSTVINGTSRPSQVESNVKALEWKLSAADMAEIDQILAG